MPSTKEIRAHDAAQAPIEKQFPYPNLDQAFCAAQAVMPHAVFDKVNPHFRSKYASLNSIITACVPCLNAVGIVVYQPTVFTPEGFFVRTILRYSRTGEEMVAEYPITPGTPQGMGTQITYGRRQTLSSLCGVTAEEDDDANAAEKAAKPAPRVVGLNVRSDADGVVLVAAEQRDELIDLCEKYKVDKAGFCKYFDVPSIADVPEHRYEEAKAKIEQSGRKRGLA